MFRDDASLSANPALWSSIEEALNDSEFFVLLASPQAAASPWVQRETTFWTQNRSARTFLIVLTEGDVWWDPAVGDFDGERTTALPTSLRGFFHEEPRFIDLRWARNADDVSLHNANFRNAVADIAAPLHRRSKDGLAGDDVRQHRRTMALARSAVVTLSLLLVLAVIATVVAVNRQGAAEERQKLALGRLLLPRQTQS